MTVLQISSCTKKINQMPDYWQYQSALGFGKQELNVILLQKIIVDGETYACAPHLV